MIQVTRSPQPVIISQKQSDWIKDLCRERTTYYQELEQFNLGHLEEKPKFPNAKKSRYAHQEIKKQLKNMFGYKCAYCESPVAGSSHQHVEHFRPQSIYPKLAYDWENLLMACGRCNSDHKKAQFPLNGNQQPVPNTENPCLLDDSDDNLLINPCNDDPERFFTFVDETMVCIDGNIRGVKTREVCKLNREDLVDQRRECLMKVELIAKCYLFISQQGNNSQIQKEVHEKIKEILQPKAIYVAMTKAKFQAMGIDIAIFEE